MPLTKSALLRYLTIDKMLREYQYVRADKLKSAIEDKICCPIGQRTFEQTISDLKMEFDAPIKWDAFKKAYTYTDRTYSLIQEFKNL